MGTGGAIAYAVKQQKLTGRFLVANADTWLGCGINELVSMNELGLAAVNVADTSRYGELSLANDRVAGFMEKGGVVGRGWINAGLYSLCGELFESWDGKPFSLEEKTFPKLVAEGRLGCFKLDTDFIDIGIPEDYKKAQNELEKYL